MCKFIHLVRPNTLGPFLYMQPNKNRENFLLNFLYREESCQFDSLGRCAGAATMPTPVTLAWQEPEVVSSLTFVFSQTPLGAILTRSRNHPYFSHLLGKFNHILFPCYQHCISLEVRTIEFLKKMSIFDKKKISIDSFTSLQILVLKSSLNSDQFFWSLDLSPLPSAIFLSNLTIFYLQLSRTLGALLSILTQTFEHH